MVENIENNRIICNVIVIVSPFVLEATTNMNYNDMQMS